MVYKNVLDEKRCLKGLTLEQLASEAGCSVSTIAKAMRGKAISRLSATRIAVALGCRPADLELGMLAGGAK